MCEADIPSSVIEETGKALAQSVSTLETLEIFRAEGETVHFAYNTEKASNIPELVSFLDDCESIDNLEQALSQKISSREFIYHGSKYTFNRVDSITEDYLSFIFISREPIGDTKRGLILIIDATGIVTIATCKFNSLRNFNLELMSKLYPIS